MIQKPRKLFQVISNIELKSLKLPGVPRGLMRTSYSYRGLRSTSISYRGLMSTSYSYRGLRSNSISYRGLKSTFYSYRGSKNTCYRDLRSTSSNSYRRSRSTSSISYRGSRSTSNSWSGSLTLISFSTISSLICSRLPWIYSTYKGRKIDKYYISELREEGKTYVCEYTF